MHIAKLKVRPRKAIAPNPCVTELTAMLACWAASSDHMSTGPCSDNAKALYACMRTVPPSRKPRRSSINYHLSRLGKDL